MVKEEVFLLHRRWTRRNYPLFLPGEKNLHHHHFPDYLIPYGFTVPSIRMDQRRYDLEEGTVCKRCHDFLTTNS